jgi:hypothetical protein
MLPRTYTLSLLAALLLGAGFSGKAFGQAVLHTYEAKVESTGPYDSPKPLFTAIVDEYSTADVAHDRETRILTITTSFTIEQSWLASVSTQAGFRLSGLWRDGVDIFWREVGPEDVAGAAPAQPAPTNTAQADEN